MDQGIKNHVEIASQLNTYRDLYDKGLFLDIVKNAQENFGDYRKYSNIQLRILIARCLTHLGLRRDADAMTLKMWRNDPQIIDNADAYLEVILRRKGPLIAWSKSHVLLKNNLHTNSSRANILCGQAAILVEFRDFSSAERLLTKAKELKSDRWIALQQVYLLVAEDKYDEALVCCNKIVTRHKDYRPAVQMLSNLYQLQGDIGKAISILKPLLSSMQSYSVGIQLFNLYIQAKSFNDAERCLDVIEENLFERPGYLLNEIARAKADLLCSQERYEEAIPYFEKKSFFQNKVVDSITTNSGGGIRSVLDVPFIRQHHMTCAPASLTAISRFWGVDVSQSDVVKAICYDGSPAVDERRWVQDQGWHVIEFELNFNTAKLLIDQGIPLLLTTVEPGSAHLQVLVGYDELMGTYFLRDPYYPRLQEMLIEGAHEYYASSGPRCMIMMPASKIALLDNIKLDSRELYDAYFELNNALDRHQRSIANSALKNMMNLDSEHRLTLWAIRCMAYYDRDDRAILKQTERLLLKYPEDVNLQLSKINCLSNLDTVANTLSYLETLNQDGRGHFLVKSRLVDELRRDHRHQDRAEILIKDLLSISPLHPPTLFSWAGLLWDKGDFKKSYEISRFVTCLEDKDERYASSFFRAARYHKQTKQALDFMVDRYQRFSRSSSGPAMSLYQVLDSMGKASIGIKYLINAIKLNPLDGGLKTFLARQYLKNGQIKKCIAMANLARDICNKRDFFTLVAEIKEYQVNRPEAIACLNKVLAYEPLNMSAINSKCRLLIENGCRSDAVKFIDLQLESFPGNYGLLAAKTNVLEDSDRSGLISVYENLIDSHPDDSWAYKRISSALLSESDLDKSLEYAKMATRVNRRDPEGFLAVGKVYMANNNREDARKYFRNAVALSSDYVSGIDALLDCALDYDSQKSELLFVHEQLMTQVSYGEGILHYQRIAGRWLKNDEVNVFLHQAIEQRPDLWQSWLALANAYRDQGELEKALSILGSALKRFPLTVELYYRRADILQLMGRLDKAEEQLKEALLINPFWVEAAIQLADLFEMQGSFEQAFDQLNTAISRSPLDARPRAYLAKLQRRRGGDKDAMDNFIAAIKLEPLYDWAWLELKSLCEKLDCVDLIVKKMLVCKKQHPFNSGLARIHASILDDPEASGKILCNYLDRYPLDISVCEDYMLLLSDQSKYVPALELSSLSRWNNNVPIEIRSAKSKVLYRQGKYKQAIEIMTLVIEKNPGFFEGWWMLANWYDNAENVEKLLESVNRCCELRPGDVQTMCFAAEKLQGYGDQYSMRIKELLKQASSIDPSNKYIGLTYIDFLLEQRDFSEARHKIASLKIHSSDAFVIYRELQVSFHEKDVDGCLDSWIKISKDEASNDYVIEQSWRLINLIGAAEQSVLEIEQRIKNGSYVDENVASCLAAHYITKEGVGGFLKRLLKVKNKDGYYNKLIAEYLNALVDMSADMPVTIEEKILADIRSNLVNWKTLGYLYFDIGSWEKAVACFSDYRDRDKLEAEMLYMYSTALRKTGETQESIKVMDEAFNAKGDDSRSKILVWRFLDDYFESRESVVDLEEINEYDLSVEEEYLLSVIRLIVEVDGRKLNDCYTQIVDFLIESQKKFLSVEAGSLAQDVNKRIRKHLLRGFDRSVFEKLYWSTKLSRHFDHW